MISGVRVAAFGLSACACLIVSAATHAQPITGADRVFGTDRHLVQYYYPYGPYGPYYGPYPYYAPPPPALLHTAAAAARAGAAGDGSTAAAVLVLLRRSQGLLPAGAELPDALASGERAAAQE